MIDNFLCLNGMSCKDYSLANAHLSYKGYSVIIDYEYILHDYGFAPSNIRARNYVPVEIYFGKGKGIDLIDVKLDEHYHKADISDLLAKLEELIKEREKEDL